jgi:hypothetical protein
VEGWLTGAKAIAEELKRASEKTAPSFMLTMFAELTSRRIIMAESFVRSNGLLYKNFESDRA